MGKPLKKHFNVIEMIMIALICITSTLISTSSYFQNLKVQKQTNSSDRGVFAIATTTSLCHGEDPTTVVWDTSKMSNHLIKCLLSNKMELFPKIGKQSKFQVI